MKKTKWEKKYCITYYDAGTKHFAERTHVKDDKEAINMAKVKILEEHLRYNRDLYAIITGEENSGFEPVTITLEQLIKTGHE